MKKISWPAMLSFGLACTAAWCALHRDSWIPVLAIPLGLAAAGLGVMALWSIHKAPAMRRGRGLAISAVCLGLVTTVFSLTMLIGLFMQQFSPGPFQGHSREQDEVEAGNQMRDQPAADFTSNLPIMILDTAGQSVSRNKRTVVRARVFDSSNKGRVSLDANPAYDGLATINRRGYSTLHLPKRSYTFHTVDDQTNQVPVSLLGLPAEADWVLYAPYEDKTLMRDVLAYELANRMGRYAPRTRYLELFVRSSERPLSMRDYAGVYVLVEKIKRGKDRVNIAKLEQNDSSEPEISGGYILKRDHGERPDGKFRTQHGGPYFYVYPKAARISTAQKRWIRQYLNSFESALHGPDFTDRQNGYAAFLDVDSFIDAHWLIEMSKNVDGFRYSAFLTKDRGGKLKPEPPWDWNRSFGNANYYGGAQPKGWYSSNLRPNEISWYLRLREDPAFAQACAARWFELRKDVFDPKRISRRIDELAAELGEAQQRNFQRWPILGRQITCNSYVGSSFEDEVRWLKKWINRRIAWIDGQL